MTQRRQYTEKERVEGAILALEIGDAATAERLGIVRRTVYGWRTRYVERMSGVRQRKHQPPYTDEEMEYLIEHADEINSGKLRFRDASKALYGISGIQRTPRKVASKFYYAGLSDKVGSRRRSAEHAVYQPFETVEERDEAFAEMEEYNPFYNALDPYAERVIDDMLGGLVARLERGDGPRVYGRLREVA